MPAKDIVYYRVVVSIRGLFRFYFTYNVFLLDHYMLNDSFHHLLLESDPCFNGWIHFPICSQILTTISVRFKHFIPVFHADSTHRPVQQTHLCYAWLQVFVMGTSLILVHKRKQKSCSQTCKKLFYVFEELMNCPHPSCCASSSNHCSK